MIDIDQIKVGDKVHYQPEQYGTDRWENGKVKSIQEGNTESVFVVYNCAIDWENFKEYTAALTSKRDLYMGWRNNTDREAWKIMDIQEASKILAKACGVELYQVNFDNVKWSIGDNFKNYEWTISDARCRTVVRDWWLSLDKRSAVTFQENKCTYFIVAGLAIHDDIRAQGINEEACMIKIAEGIEKL